MVEGELEYCFKKGSKDDVRRVLSSIALIICDPPSLFHTPFDRHGVIHINIVRFNINVVRFVGFGK